MSVVCANNKIGKRSREIRDFISFINDNYDISHKILCKVVNYPCVYADDQAPAFGIFWYGTTRGKKVIEIANDLEWYRKKYKGLTKKFIIYHILHTLAHEIYHYFQLRDNKPVTENWVNHQANKILIDYVESGHCKYVKKYLENKSKSANCFFAIDPKKN
jgi:hypothetical protein